MTGKIRNRLPIREAVVVLTVQSQLYCSARVSAKCFTLAHDYTVSCSLRTDWIVTQFLLEKAKASDRAVVLEFFKRSTSSVLFHLGNEGSKIFNEPNAGGASIVSEALSMDYMFRRFGATDTITELGIHYWDWNWKKVDYICTIKKERVGVSVTRAMKYPTPDNFSVEDARRLLEKKLYGLIVAREGVCEGQQYSKSILHVWCQTHEIAVMMKNMFPTVSNEMDIENNVLMILTVSSEYCIFYDELNSVVPI